MHTSSNVMISHNINPWSKILGDMHASVGVKVYIFSYRHTDHWPSMYRIASRELSDTIHECSSRENAEGENYCCEDIDMPWCGCSDSFSLSVVHLIFIFITHHYCYKNQSTTVIHFAVIVNFILTLLAEWRQTWI